MPESDFRDFAKFDFLPFGLIQNKLADGEILVGDAAWHETAKCRRFTTRRAVKERSKEDARKAAALGGLSSFGDHYKFATSRFSKFDRCYR